MLILSDFLWFDIYVFYVSIYCGFIQDFWRGGEGKDGNWYSFAALLLDNDTENTSIMQINLGERCDRLMLTILLSNFKAISHFSLIFVST